MKVIQPRITVDNYLDFLPSDFVASFLSDIDYAAKRNKPMDMENFLKEYATADDNSKCLPCLGGVACMNFGIEEHLKNQDIAKLKSAELYYSALPKSPFLIATYTSRIGDYSRLGHIKLAYNSLKKLYPSLPFLEDTNFSAWFVKNNAVPKMFLHVLYPEDFDSLREHVSNFVKALKSIGY